MSARFKFEIGQAEGGRWWWEASVMADGADYEHLGGGGCFDSPAEALADAVRKVPPEPAGPPPQAGLWPPRRAP